ncbi:hypothetical protein LTR95_017796, partial [Oleoguttula sp. CCFEE 5521]
TPIIFALISTFAKHIFRFTPYMSTQVQDRLQSGHLAGLIRRTSTRCYKAIERRASRRSIIHTSTSRQSKSLATNAPPTFEIYRVDLPAWVGRRRVNPISASQHDSNNREVRAINAASNPTSSSNALLSGQDSNYDSTSGSVASLEDRDTPSPPLACVPRSVQGYTRAQLIDMPQVTPPLSAAYSWPDHPLLAMTRKYRELLQTHYKPQFEMELAYTVKGEAWPDYTICPQRWQYDPHKSLLAHNMVYAHHYELDQILQRQDDLLVLWVPHQLPFGGGGEVAEETAADAYVHNGTLSWWQIVNAADGRDCLRCRANRCKMLLAESRRRAVLAGHTVAPFGPCGCRECTESEERKSGPTENIPDREEQAEEAARGCVPAAL